MNNFYPNMPQFPQGRPPYLDVLQQQLQYLGIKGRPVSSYDEAKASMIDFDGSVFYFPDTANQRIYTKQINLDGTSTLKVYVLSNQQSAPQESVMGNRENISREEFDKTIKSLIDEIRKMKGAQSDVQPTANANTNVSKQF